MREAKVVRQRETQAETLQSNEMKKAVVKKVFLVGAVGWAVSVWSVGLVSPSLTLRKYVCVD